MKSKDRRYYWSQRRRYQLISKKKRSKIRVFKGRRIKHRKSIRRLFIASMNVRASKLPKK